MSHHVPIRGLENERIDGVSSVVQDMVEKGLLFAAGLGLTLVFVVSHLVPVLGEYSTGPLLKTLVGGSVAVGKEGLLGLGVRGA